MKHLLLALATTALIISCTETAENTTLTVQQPLLSIEDVSLPQNRSLTSKDIPEIPTHVVLATNPNSFVIATLDDTEYIVGGEYHLSNGETTHTVYVYAKRRLPGDFSNYILIFFGPIPGHDFEKDDKLEMDITPILSDTYLLHNHAGIVTYSGNIDNPENEDFKMILQWRNHETNNGWTQTNQTAESITGDATSFSFEGSGGVSGNRYQYGTEFRLHYYDPSGDDFENQIVNFDQVDLEVIAPAPVISNFQWSFNSDGTVSYSFDITENLADLDFTIRPVWKNNHGQVFGQSNHILLTAETVSYSGTITSKPVNLYQFGIELNGDDFAIRTLFFN